MSASGPKVGYVFDAVMGKHRPAGVHWERPERIYSIHQALLNVSLLEFMKKIPVRKATFEELSLVHKYEYLENLIDLLKKQDQTDEPFNNDADLYVSEGTLEAALNATGGVLDLVRMVSLGNLDSGFAIVRPPGHHATGDQCMGFCFFNNLGIAAMDQVKKGKKVLIVDWDVHHGNGTEDLILRYPRLANHLRFFTIHRWDNGKFYPKNGTPYEGQQMLKIGFNGSKGDSYYLNAFDNTFKRWLGGWKPDIILVSCGFDAAVGDPLGGCKVTPNGYYEMTKKLMEICPKVVLILEGGYNLQSISKSAIACTQALMKLPLNIPTNLNLEHSEITTTSNADNQ